MSETVSFGSARRPWRSRPAIVPAVVLATVVAGVGWASSSRRSEVERAQLVQCAATADAAVGRAEKRLAALASYIAPTVDPRYYRTYEGLYTLLSRDAAEQRDDVADALDVCHRVQVWWLHHDNRATRTAYLRLLEAELARLDGIVSDGTSFHEGYGVVARLRADAAQRVE